MSILESARRLAEEEKKKKSYKKNSTTTSTKTTATKTTSSEGGKPTSTNKNSSIIESARRIAGTERKSGATYSSAHHSSQPSTTTKPSVITKPTDYTSKYTQTKTTFTSNLTEEERKARIKEINAELNTLGAKASGYSRAKAYGASKALLDAEKKDNERMAELRKELKTLERVGTFTNQEILQWDIDDKKNELSRLNAKINSYGQRPSGTEIEGWKKAISDRSKVKTELDALEIQQAEYKKVEKLNKLNENTTKITSKEDFEQNSKYSPTKPKTAEQLKAEGYIQDVNGEWYKRDGLLGGRKTYTGEDSDLYTYINDESKREKLGIIAEARYGTNTYEDLGYNTLNEDEIGAFNYLYHQDRKNGTNTAEAYLQTISPLLQQRAMDVEAKRYKEVAKEHPVTSSIISLGTNAQNAMMFPTKVVTTATGMYDDMPSVDMFGNRTQAIRSGVSEDMGVVGKLAYNATMSIGDMGVAMLVGGGNAKAIQAIMSSSAGSSTISEAKKNGASDGKALVLGLGSAAIEWATEKYSVEAILKNPKTIRGYLAANTFTEAAEEGASNVANLALDAIVSEAFGERNNIEQRIDYLMAYEGKTADEALKIAFNETLQSLGEDILVGGLTGFGMSSTVASPAIVEKGIDRIRNKSNKNTTQEQQTTTEQPIEEQDSLEKAAVARNATQTARNSSRETPLAQRLEAQSQNNEQIAVEDVKKATGLGEEGSKLIAELANKDGVTFSQAERTVKTAYLAGYANVEGAKVNFATDTQINAFTAGKKDKVMDDLANKEKAKNATVYDSGVVNNDNFKKLSTASQELLSTLANDHMMSVEVRDNILAATVKGKNYYASASHQDGKMTGSMSTEKPLIVWAIHEDGHRMEQMATDEWNVLANALYERAESLGRATKLGVTQGLRFDAIKAKYDEAGQTQNTSGYFGEVVMRELETIFASPEEFNAWRAELDNNAQVKTAWQRFMDFLYELIEDIKRVIANRKLSKEARAEAKAELAELERIKELYADAYMATRDTVAERANAKQSAEPQAETTTEAKNKPVISEKESTNIETPAKVEIEPQANMSKKATDRRNIVLGDGKKSVAIADGQVFVTNSKDILPSPANRNVFISVNDVNVAKTEFGATKSKKTGENISKMLASDFTPVRENFVDGTLKGVGEVRVFTDENGREIALEKNVAEYFEGYNLEATFRGGKPYAIKAIDNDGKVAGVAMAVWMDKSGQKYDVTESKTNYSLEEEDIDDVINQSMTMEQAKDMIQRAFVIGGIKEWFDGEYRNGDEWLKGEGADAVALVVENEWTLQQKFLDKIQGVLDGDFYAVDIIEAYEKGTLTGKVKQNVVKRLDTFKSTKATDTRVFAPKEIKNAQEIYKVALERVTNSNREKVYQARADIIMFAHNRGAAEALGLTQSELNKKLSTWARYTARAKEVSMRINKDVALFNRWTGIENSNVLNRATVSQAELDNLVNEIKGDNNGWQRSYIMRTMLALDTHIDYSELNFEFVGTPKTSFDNKSVNGLYDNSKRKITVKYNAPHTVAHEMGHFLDYQWARDFGLNSQALTDGFGRDKQTDPDVKQFLTNFDEFIEQIEDSADLRSGYTMDRKEVFARFVAKFVQWVDLVANGQRSYAQEYLSYNDKFTASQYIEFVRLLQEKSMLDSKRFEANETNSAKNLEIKIKEEYNGSVNYLLNGNGKTKSEQYGVMWTLDMGVLDKNEVSAFYEKISETHNNKYQNYREALDGQLIYEIENKLIYTDGDYDYPHISKVIAFNTDDSYFLEYGRECFYDGEKYGYSTSSVVEVVEAVLGEGNVETTTYDSYEADKRSGKSSDKRTDGTEVNQRSRKDVVEKSFSLKDSDGKSLTKEQAEYFKDSKIRDGNGNLLVMYHGTIRGGFTVFGGRKDYWYFTNDKKYSYAFEGRKKNGQFYPYTKERMEKGEITPQRYKVYLNVTNPYIADIDTVEDALYWDKSLASLLREKGYDALMVEDMSQVVVLNENQIKNTTNKNPTDDPDINYSLEENNDLSSKDRKELLDIIEHLKSEFETTKFAKADQKKLAKMTRELIKEYSSKADFEETFKDIDELYNYMANGEDGHPPVWEDVYNRAYNIAHEIVENAIVVDDYTYQEYKNLRDYLRKTPMKFDARYNSVPINYENFNDFRKHNMGRLKFTKDGMSIDSVYQELSYLYPEFFDVEEQTNSAEQLDRIEEVLYEIQPTEVNPFDRQIEQVSMSLANDLTSRFFDIPQAKPTFADKLERRVVEARVAGAKKVDAVRQQKDAKIKKLIETQKDKTKKQLEKIREQRDTKVKKEQEKRRTAISKMSETKKARELRAKIVRHVGELNKTLLKATDKKHIPPELENAVVAVLYNINMESNYSYDVETGTYKKNDEGLPTNKTKAFLELKEVYEQIAKNNDYGLTIAPELFDMSGEGVANIFDEVMKLSDKKLVDMSSSELAKIYDTIRLVEHSIAVANKMFAMQRWENLTETAKAFEKSVATRRAKRSLMKSHYTLDIENPITFFSHFGEAGQELYQALREAQDNEQVMIDELADIVQDIVSLEEVQKADKEIHEFTTAEGKKLILSKAHIMDIYLLYNRKQGRKHLLYDPESEHFGNGIHQPEIKGKKIRRDSESTRLTKTDLGNIISKLSESDKAIADKMQQATLKLAEWGNKACMKVFGYEKFNDPDYWTIKSARESINQTIEKNKDQVRSIKNMGSAKSVEDKATNALDIGGVFNVFNQHASDMICYSAWLEVMEDATKLYNYTFRDDNGYKTNRTFDGMLEKYAGEGGSKYYFNLMKDIQNGIGIAPDTATEQIYTKLFGKAAKAKVAYKLTVVAQQPMAIVRATSVINPLSIMQAIGKGGVNLPVWAVSKAKNIISKNNAKASEWYGGWQKALKYAPIASRKAIGGYEINANSSGLKGVLYKPETAKGKVVDALKESPLWAAGKADEITWGILWNACEIETSKNKSLEKGSDAYYEAVKKLFDKVINETQVVDGVLQRSQLMRSSSGWVKPLTTFKGEPTMALNGVIRAYDQLRYETNPAKRGKAIKSFSRTVSVFVASAIFTAFARSLAVGVTGDDDEEYWKKVWNSFSGIQGDEETWWDYVKNIGLKSDVVNNMNPLSWLPVTSEMMSALQGYDVERLDVASIGEFINAGTAFINSLDAEGKNTVPYATRNLLLKFAELTGYSPYNLVRDIEGAIRTSRNETNDVKGLYDMEKWRTKPASNTSAYIDILYKAYTINKEDYEYIYNDMIENGVDADKIQSGMETRMKESEGVEKASELSKRYMSPDKEKRYDSSIRKVKSSGAWKSATTIQRKNAEADLYEFITSTSEDMVKTRAEAGAFGVDETEYTLWQLAIEMADQPKGQKGSGSYDLKEKAEAINSLNLGDEEIAYFFGKGLNESSKEELNETRSAGIDLREYVNFKAATSEMKSDKNAKGNSIPNSKKRKVVNYLNNANLTDDEWEYFYYEIMNYKK